MSESWDVTISEAGQIRDDGNLVARWVWVLMKMCHKKSDGLPSCTGTSATVIPVMAVR